MVCNLQWLLSIGCRIHLYAVHVAAGYGHFECPRYPASGIPRITRLNTSKACNLKLLLAAKCPIHRDAIIDAKKNGHHECVALLESI